jgi:translation elongation factor EF-Ts
MQIASNPDISVVSPDDISESKQKSASIRKWQKNQNRNKIVEGRIEESKKQVLLDQEYIRDPNITR